MVACVASMSSAMVLPALPMIIPGTIEGTRNLTNASSSAGQVGEGGREREREGEGERERQNCGID